MKLLSAISVMSEFFFFALTVIQDYLGVSEIKAH